MERLNTKSSNSIESLIKKLEILVVEDKITDEKIDTIQTSLDKIDEETDEPNFQLFELQSLIYYARNDKTKSLEFIEDALELNSNVVEYSKLGALLAEIHMEKFVRERLSNKNREEETEEIEEAGTDENDSDYLEEEVEIDVEKSFESLRKDKKEKYDKVFKSVKNTGTSVEALGFVSLFVSIFFFIPYGSDTNEDTRFVLAILAVATYLIILFYIYLGKYIKSFYRPRLRSALWTVLLISIFAYFSILSLLVAVYVIISLFKVKNVINDKEFEINVNKNGSVYYSQVSIISILLATLGWIAVIIYLLQG